MSIVVLPFYHKVCRWIKDRMNGPMPTYLATTDGLQMHWKDELECAWSDYCQGKVPTLQPVNDLREVCNAVEGIPKWLRKLCNLTLFS